MRLAGGKQEPLMREISQGYVLSVNRDRRKLTILKSCIMMEKSPHHVRETADNRPD